MIDEFALEMKCSSCGKTLAGYDQRTVLKRVIPVTNHFACLVSCAWPKSDKEEFRWIRCGTCQSEVERAFAPRLKKEEKKKKWHAQPMSKLPTEGVLER